jgi:hypothetical protein
MKDKKQLLAFLALTPGLFYITAYSDMSEYRYPSKKRASKTQLTNKQKKARAKAKRAKQARKLNRK